jgi:hypothetical protein
MQNKKARRNFSAWALWFVISVGLIVIVDFEFLGEEPRDSLGSHLFRRSLFEKDLEDTVANSELIGVRFFISNITHSYLLKL